MDRTTRRVKAQLTVEERDLILEHVTLIVDPKLEEKLRKKRSRHGYVTIELDAEELKDLIGCVAGEANHTSEKWLAASLDEIFDELQLLESELMLG